MIWYSSKIKILSAKMSDYGNEENNFIKEQIESFSVRRGKHHSRNRFCGVIEKLFSCDRVEELSRSAYERESWIDARSWIEEQHECQ